MEGNQTQPEQHKTEEELTTLVTACYKNGGTFGRLLGTLSLENLGFLDRKLGVWLNCAGTAVSERSVIIRGMQREIIHEKRMRRTMAPSEDSLKKSITDKLSAITFDIEEALKQQ